MLKVMLRVWGACIPPERETESVCVGCTLIVREGGKGWCGFVYRLRERKGGRERESVSVCVSVCVCVHRVRE